MKSRLLPMLSVLALALSVVTPVTAHDGEHPEEGKQEEGWPGSVKAQEVARAMLADSQPAVDAEAQSGTTCTDGLAGEYPCQNVDLLAFVPLADMGGGKGNDIWGWTDPETGREYALQGRTSGTSFVDITDPTNPVYLGNLPTTRFNSTWRDLKVYADHVFVVSESRNHGMQVFDLTRLRSVTSPPVTFSADARYTGFSTAHNIAINEASGFAYAIGTDTCAGGLHIVDIRSPLNPVQAGCYSGDGYTHDTQCVNYAGPDADHNGKEICFASNEDTVTIVDVTNKSAPQMLARVSYPGVQYTHQGWLTGDQRYFLVDDELDESRNGHDTHTYVFDMADLEAPALVHTFTGTTSAIDHNQYVVGDHSFQSNYRAGLRIIDVSDKQALREVAYFDTYPADDNTDFNGSWSNYPFFGSGIVAVSDVERGLFVVKPNLGPANGSPSVSLDQPAAEASLSATVAIEITATDTEDAAGTLTVEWKVDGGAWQSATYDSSTDSYVATWDSTAVDNGAHTVTARATDAGGASASDANSVTVDNPNTAPTASFTYVCANLACDFDASGSSDGDGSIGSYAWDFGDGSTGSGATVQHSFATGGEYTVVLTVTDNDGSSDADSQILKVDGPSARSMHVGDLDARAELKGKSGRWEVFVTVTVHDDTDAPLGGVTVNGTFSGAASGAVSGTTGADGSVAFATGTLSGGTTVSFTVTELAGTLAYDPTANHDPDGDSDGTTITVTPN